MRRHYRRYGAPEREPASDTADVLRMPEMDIEGGMPSVDVGIGEARITDRIPSSRVSNIGEGLKGKLPLVAGIGLIGIAAWMAMGGKKGGRRSFAGRSSRRRALNGFVSEHPWMTFFLASTAISAIAGIAKSVVAPGTSGELPFQISAGPR